ncbi:hypothetical protein Vafri_15525, partial [Volvox africanus]
MLTAPEGGLGTANSERSQRSQAPVSGLPFWPTATISNRVSETQITLTGQTLTLPGPETWIQDPDPPPLRSPAAPRSAAARDPDRDRFPPPSSPIALIGSDPESDPLLALAKVLEPSNPDGLQQLPPEADEVPFPSPGSVARCMGAAAGALAEAQETCFYSTGRAPTAEAASCASLAARE